MVLRPCGGVLCDAVDVMYALGQPPLIDPPHVPSLQFAIRRWSRDYINMHMSLCIMRIQILDAFLFHRKIHKKADTARRCELTNPGLHLNIIYLWSPHCRSDTVLVLRSGESRCIITSITHMWYEQRLWNICCATRM